MAYKPGEVIGDRYRILSQLGTGAHGIVYRARDLETRDEIALKFLGDGRGLDPEFSRRIEREAIVMAKLRGTSAVYVHGLNVHHDGMLYLAMELLSGQDLEDYLQAAEKLGGRIKAKKLLELLRPIVSTLEAAHKQGIIHRDLKPSNIFVVDVEHGGGVRLLDFGLAKVLDANTLTQDGFVAGTPSYIAPESWRGNPRLLDHRIDVYSLGVIVFRALSGRVPVPSTNVLEICQWALKGERPSLHALRSSLPASIDLWVQKVLAVEPDDRYQTIESMWTALEAVLGQKHETAPF
jgi:serine/threonine protein kinase